MRSNDYYRFANTITPLAHEARRDPDTAQRQGYIMSHGRARMDTETRNISVDQCNQWEYMSHESHGWARMQGA